ncbi:MAG: PIN domain-containing protein [Spirochaetaceae bacterium]|nr:PIN domain-containing protein [Spirochaetaceae bacterium]
MNIYLLDTNIISEPTKPSPSESVMNSIAENFDHSCICSVIWAEILTGIKCLADGKRKNALLNYYLNTIQKAYEILPFDSFAASIYSDLVERLKKKENPLPKLDLMIAATAISNNLILVTRNTADFEPIKEVSNLMTENWFEQ